MELQMRMDPSWRKLRSYSSMANTQRKHALQLPTLDGRPSSSDIHGLPITIWKLTGLTRVSPCLDALLSVKGSQTEAWWRIVMLHHGRFCRSRITRVPMLMSDRDTMQSSHRHA